MLALQREDGINLENINAENTKCTFEVKQQFCTVDLICLRISHLLSPATINADILDIY